MADYYSILSKAVSALEPNTASARQRLYERARSAMSAEFEGTCPPFDASDIAAVKEGLKSAIERIEAEALPAWLQQECNESANDRSATDRLPDQRAYRFLDASEIADAERGLERAMENLAPEAIADRWGQETEVVAGASDGPATVDLPVEMPFEAQEIAPSNQGLEAVPNWLEQFERAVCTNDCPTMADLPAEIQDSSAFPTSEIVAGEQSPENAGERTRAVPEWLLQPERVVRADDCPATAANQNDDSPGPIKKLWTRLAGWTFPSRSASPGRDTWLTDLLERASDDADNDQDFAPKRTRSS